MATPDPLSDFYAKLPDMIAHLGRLSPEAASKQVFDGLVPVQKDPPSYFRAFHELLNFGHNRAQ